MPDNSLQITRTTEFQLNVEMALAQEPGILYPLAVQGSHEGDSNVQLEDQFGTLQMTPITSRLGATAISDINVERRWLFKQPRAAIAVPIDVDDMMSTRVDLKSPIVMAQADAARRYHDSQWLRGFYGNARVGVDGGTVVPFASSNIVPVNQTEAGPTGAATGMNYAKLVTVRKIIRQKFALPKGQNPTVIVTAEDIEDLLYIPEIKNSDFNSPQWFKNVEKLQACQQGEVHSFMGFDFLPAEIGNSSSAGYGDAALLTVDGNGYRRVPVHVPMGTHFGAWSVYNGHIDQLPGNNHNWQVSGYACSSATRLRENRCFQILCA